MMAALMGAFGVWATKGCVEESLGKSGVGSSWGIGGRPAEGTPCACMVCPHMWVCRVWTADPRHSVSLVSLPVAAVRSEEVEAVVGVSGPVHGPCLPCAVGCASSFGKLRAACRRGGGGHRGCCSARVFPVAPEGLAGEVAHLEGDSAADREAGGVGKSFHKTERRTVCYGHFQGMASWPRWDVSSLEK